MESVYVPTRRGPVLAGMLFPASGDPARPAKTVVIAITGIHGNLYSNPFYHNVGDTLNSAGIDFAYAQTCDAFGQMRSVDLRTEGQVLIGSWNERFSYTVDDVGAWMDYAEHIWVFRKLCLSVCEIARPIPHGRLATANEGVRQMMPRSRHPFTLLLSHPRLTPETTPGRAA